MINPAGMENLKKIVIAIDNDPAAENVALSGFQLGLQLNAEIALVSVIDTNVLKIERTILPTEFKEILKNNQHNLQQKLLTTIFKGHKVSTFLREGKPYEVILRVADEWYADIIVIGTHGKGQLSRLLLGSVTEKVIKHSKKPVFIVPQTS